jgi:hypothetical protein
MLCDVIDMSDEDAQEILKHDKQFKNLVIYHPNKIKITNENIELLFSLLFEKIKESFKFEQNLNKIIESKYPKKKLSEYEYHDNYYCYFLALKNVYKKLITLKNDSKSIKNIKLSILQLSATILEKFKDLYIESRKKIIIMNGKIGSFKPLNEESLTDYNQTILSYNDFMTVYENALFFLNDNCEDRCEFYNKIRTKIKNLKAECSRFNSQIVYFMNEQGDNLKNKFVQVKQDPELKNNPRKNNSSSAATEQTGLLTQNRNKRNNKSSAATEQTGLLTQNGKNSKRNKRNNPSSVATEQKDLLPKNKQKSGCSIL